ncbi:MAG: dockerin type I repeat-containing protein, partial [Muribaculaceae bacterium]|nr:dockerin type I repeat-containing protein [Muribaculaceae bacterium]
VCLTAMAQTPRVKGDVNGDGSVTSVDVTALYNFLLNGDDSGLANGDVDGDGYVTSGDVTFVYNILLGIEPAEEEHEYVDLGLPSGTLWATTNVGADKPEDYGDYFAWGETAPKDFYDWSNYKWCDGSNYTLTKYCVDSYYGNDGFTDGKTELDPEDDAATANWGAEWCMPTIEQQDELLTECTWEKKTRNGVDGYLVTSKHNGASLFLPAASVRVENYLIQEPYWGSYWSRTLYVDKPDCTYALYFDTFNKDSFFYERYFGQSVRPVRVQEKEHEYVDMGLPSGTLWATTNVGADKPEDYGDYFAWGETAPKDVYDWSTYQWCNGAHNTLTKYCANSSHGYNGFVDNLTELEPEDDAATANWGAEWCMPSKDQIQELQANCTWEWTQRNNVDGYLVTSNLNGATLFFPAAGYNNNSPTAVGTRGYYWSRTHYGKTSYLAYNLLFSTTNVGCGTDGRNFGRSVRPVRVQEKEHEYVDLGLPSGTLWSKTNVGADNPEDYGDYFAWGETTPKDVYDWSTYQWCNGSENSLTKYCTKSDYGYNDFVDYMTELDPEDDAATANWGEEWCMPSQSQLQELMDFCTCQWTTLNDVNGYLFTSDINGATLFLPAAGYHNGAPLSCNGTNGFYWSRTLNVESPHIATDLYYDNEDFMIWGWGSRFLGLSVRPVRKLEHEYVDLGLPSGTKWSKTNVGADKPEDYGDYFAWGETTSKENYSWSTYQWCNGSYNQMTKYCTDNSYGYNGFTDDKTELDPEDDAATANWGEEWCMPSFDQIQELKDNCTTEWITRNGVNGRLFISNINGETLFIPAAGYRDGRSLDNVGSSGSTWSRTLDTYIPDYAYYLSFGSEEVILFGFDRSRGRNVRPVHVQYPVHKCVNLGLPSGTLWATMNIGASSPEDYGVYFSWGETMNKIKYREYDYLWYEAIELGGYDYFLLTKYCTDSNYGYDDFVDNKTELDAEDDAATAIWGPKWRMPSNDQIQELIDNCTSQWTTMNGVNGRLFTSNFNGASLFLPAAGYCWYAGHYDIGSSGNYWSRTLDSTYPNSACRLGFDSGSVNCNDYSRYYGRSVRAVRMP